MQLGLYLEVELTKLNQQVMLGTKKVVILFLFLFLPPLNFVLILILVEILLVSISIKLDKEMLFSKPAHLPYMLVLIKLPKVGILDLKIVPIAYTL